MSIEWHTEEGGWYATEAERNAWLTAVVDELGKRIHQLSYRLVSDETLLRVNRTHLAHNSYTDIITFDYSRADRLRGEIYISHERVLDNAERWNSAPEEEQRRVIVHGLLHLCGWQDDTRERKEQMREKENWALEMWPGVSRGTKR